MKGNFAKSIGSIVHVLTVQTGFIKLRNEIVWFSSGCFYEPNDYTRQNLAAGTDSPYPGIR